ncbi:hypothetical protein [uncultured Rikenella sp.]|uniref:hypothetical protein n=1 Tax=uncultured Rikenella sp. TaxID=368003 RepID=UPI0025D1DAB4|nr:hypothetical protein [uncultured Rikenella sp.]
MKKVFFLCALILSACDSLSGLTPKKIGDTKIYLENNNIIAEDFPYPREMGFSVDWGSFSFKEFDEFVYQQVIKSQSNVIWIVIQHKETDSYGHSALGEKITIGKIDVIESKKYADFQSWNRHYSTYKMWAKDKDEYNNTYRRPYDGDVAPRLVPTYKPKSIR